MNDEKLKKGIKRSLMLFFLGLILIAIIVLYISISPKPKKTIYDEFSDSEMVTTEVSKVFLETKGINKEEFEKYLSVGAILTREDLPTLGIPTIIIRMGFPSMPFLARFSSSFLRTSRTSGASLLRPLPLLQSVASARIPLDL